MEDECGIKCKFARNPEGRCTCVCKGEGHGQGWKELANRVESGEEKRDAVQE